MLGTMVPPRRRMVVLVAALLALGAGIGILVSAAFAQPGVGIKRTVLQRVDEPGATNYEAVMAIAEIPPGGTSGKHRHPGIELAYVLEGSVVIEREGQPTVTVKAGEALKNEAAVHNAKNIGKTPVKILAVYLVEKGKPMAEPVP